MLFEAFLGGFDAAQILQTLIVIGVVVFIATGVLKSISRRKRKWRGRRKGSKPALRVVRDAEDDLLSGRRYDNLRDPKVQMEYVKHADFKPARLLNKEEAKVLRVLEAVTIELNQGHRVMAQVSLGEVLTPTAPNKDFQRKAFSSINSKRIDLGIFDRSGILKVVVEYQGGGHHQKGAFMRDAVKREALRKAGIPMIEVTPNDHDGLIAMRVKTELRPTS